MRRTVNELADFLSCEFEGDRLDAGVRGSFGGLGPSGRFNLCGIAAPSGAGRRIAGEVRSGCAGPFLAGKGCATRRKSKTRLRARGGVAFARSTHRAREFTPRR